MVCWLKFVPASVHILSGNELYELIEMNVAQGICIYRLYVGLDILFRWMVVMCILRVHPPVEQQRVYPVKGYDDQCHYSQLLTIKVFARLSTFGRLNFDFRIETSLCNDFLTQWVPNPTHIVMYCSKYVIQEKPRGSFLSTWIQRGKECFTLFAFILHFLVT